MNHAQEQEIAKTLPPAVAEMFLAHCAALQRELVHVYRALSFANNAALDAREELRILKSAVAPKEEPRPSQPQPPKGTQ